MSYYVAPHMSKIGKKTNERNIALVTLELKDLTALA